MAAKRIHVLQFINSLARGGAEKRLAEVVANLSAGDFDFTVCCLSATGAYEEAVRNAGARIEVLGYRGIRKHGRLRPARLLEPARAVRRLRALIDAVNPQVVHAWIPVCNALAGWAMRPGRYAGMPLIASRVFTGEYRDRKPAIRWPERWASGRADLVYCNSQAVRDDVAAREPWIDARKLRTIRNGVDTDRFAPAVTAAQREAWRASFGIGKETLAIAVAGALRAHKGHSVALHAARLMHMEFPNARWIFAGADQGEGPKLLRMANELGLRDIVDFRGAINDMPRLMAACDTLALPSWQEGLPNVLLEAQAAGLPCVASALPGCAEALANGETGLLVAAGVAEHLAEALGKLLRDVELRERMGMAGRLRAMEHFAIETMMNEFDSMYRTAARDGRVQMGAAEKRR